MWLDLTFARTRFNSIFGNTWSRMPWQFRKCFLHTKVKTRKSREMNPNYSINCVAGEFGHLSEMQALLTPGNYLPVSLVYPNVWKMSGFTLRKLREQWPTLAWFQPTFQLFGADGGRLPVSSGSQTRWLASHWWRAPLWRHRAVLFLEPRVTLAQLLLVVYKAILPLVHLIVR